MHFLLAKQTQQAVLVVLFKTKSVYIRFESQQNVLNYIPHYKTLHFNTIASHIAVIY